MIKYIFLFSFFLFSSFVSAADYTWTRHGNYTLKFSSAQGVCDRYKGEWNTCGSSGYTGCAGDTGQTSATVVMQNPGEALCNVYSEPSHYKYGSFIAVRSGSSCPSGSVYNSGSGSCDPIVCPAGQSWDAALGFCVNDDPCSALNGTTSGFKQQGNSSDPNPFYKPVPGSKHWLTPRYVVTNGCAMLVNGGASCKVFADGDYSCTGSATYTGDTASPGADNTGPASTGCTGDECPDSDPTPASTASNSCTPWVYGEFGLARNCSSVNNSNQPGKGSCLTDGSLVCVAASPTPTSTATAISSDQTQTTDANTGNVTTINNDTVNKTICQAGACTTSTTTNKTTVVKNSGGDQVSKDNQCTGPGCASSTNPDGDGDGLGDCVKDCGSEEEEQEGSATVSESCEVAPACDGDPFQCAILIQVHYNSCQERRPLTDEESQTIDDAIESGYTANDNAQAELDGALGGFFGGFQSAASGNGSPGSAQCLPDKTFPFFGSSIVLPFSMVCPYLELFRMALLAISYLIAARIIHTQI